MKMKMALIKLILTLIVCTFIYSMIKIANNDPNASIYFGTAFIALASLVIIVPVLGVALIINRSYRNRMLNSNDMLRILNNP